MLEFDKTQVIVNANSGSLDNPVFAGSTTQFKFDVSREAEFSIGLYMRNPGPGGREEDMFLGSCKILPSFEEADPKAAKKGQAPTSKGLSGTDWVPLSSSQGGSVLVGMEYRHNQDLTLKMADFDLLKVVGKGSFGKVMQVKYGARSIDVIGRKLMFTGNVIPSEYTPSRRSGKHISFHARKSTIPSRSARYLRRSTILSLCHSSFHSSPPRSSTWSWRL